MFANRIMRSVRREFPLVVFWIYVLAFVVAFPFMFVFPQVTLVLFALALAGLPFVIIAARIIAAMQEWVDRRVLLKGGCPACGSSDVIGDVETGWCCDACDAVFRSSGERVEEHELSDEQAMSVAC